MSEDEVINTLAEYMYDDIEHMDPMDDRHWDELTERDKDLFRNVMAHILDLHKDIITKYWEIREAGRVQPKP